MRRNLAPRLSGLSAAVLLVVLTWVAPLDAAQSDRKTGAKGADTPQALVTAYHRDLARKDWRSCFQRYDPKFRGHLLFQMFFAMGITNDLELIAIVKNRTKVEFSGSAVTSIPGLRQDDTVSDEILWYEAFEKQVDDLPGFVDEFCRRLDVMEGVVFPVFGQVGEFKIQGDQAIGYWMPPPREPIAPTMIFRDGQTINDDGDAALPHPERPPDGGHPDVSYSPTIPPGSERRVPVYFRRIGGNWYFTIPDPPPALSTAERAKQLRVEVKSLWVTLSCSRVVTLSQSGVAPTYVLKEDPYCDLRLGVRPFAYKSARPKVQLARLTKAQAKKLIDHLTAEGYLDQAVELGKQKIPQRSLLDNCYTLQVSTQNLQLHEDLGWGPAMLKRLNGLRTALEGDAAEAMDALLAALAEDRRKWEMEAAKSRRVRRDAP